MKLLIAVVLVVFTACVPLSSYSTPSASYGSGVYINGQQLSAPEKAQLDVIVGASVPAGRYALDAQGNFGYEGASPVINLVALVRARQQEGAAEDNTADDTGEKEPFSMYSTDSAGQGSSFVSDGDCMIMSTPSGSFSSGC